MRNHAAVLVPKKNKIREDKGTTVVSVIVVTLFALCCVAPFIYVFLVSFMPYSEYIEDPMKVIPSHFDLSAYRQMFELDLLWSGYRNTILVTVFGTALNVFLLVISGYPLSKTNLKGHKVFMSIIMFTMFFNGGMIPNYVLVRYLNIDDTLLSLILPGCISVFNLLLMKNFITTTIPVTLEESATIDGANDLRILFSIVFPLLKPAVATMIVFCAVGHWNSYYSAMLYLQDREKWTLPLILRELIVVDNANTMSQTAQMLQSQNMAHSFTLKMAAIVITVLPILVVYPFMQKYFVKGVTLGSVKE
jgi:putative aldouronate transport system permease protein